MKCMNEERIKDVAFGTVMTEWNSCCRPGSQLFLKITRKVSIDIMELFDTTRTADHIWALYLAGYDK